LSGTQEAQVHDREGFAAYSMFILRDHEIISHQAVGQPRRRRIRRQMATTGTARPIIERHYSAAYSMNFELLRS
jgi:hypothetical protein